MINNLFMKFIEIVYRGKTDCDIQLIRTHASMQYRQVRHSPPPLYTLVVRELIFIRIIIIIIVNSI